MSYIVPAVDASTFRFRPEVEDALDKRAKSPELTVTYNGDGSIATVTENGVATDYTYNPDGTVATDVRAGVTRTYSYDGSGNLTGITVS